MICIFDVHTAAFAIGIRMPCFFVTTDALQHGFNLRVFVGVMTILAALRVRRLDVISVIEIFDDAPFAVLPPIRTFFRIAQLNGSCWRWLAGNGSGLSWHRSWRR